MFLSFTRMFSLVLALRFGSWNGPWKLKRAVQAIVDAQRACENLSTRKYRRSEWTRDFYGRSSMLFITFQENYRKISTLRLFCLFCASTFDFRAQMLFWYYAMSSRIYRFDRKKRRRESRKIFPFFLWRVKSSAKLFQLIEMKWEFSVKSAWVDVEGWLEWAKENFNFTSLLFFVSFNNFLGLFSNLQLNNFLVSWKEELLRWNWDELGKVVDEDMRWRGTRKFLHWMGRKKVKRKRKFWLPIQPFYLLRGVNNQSFPSIPAPSAFLFFFRILYLFFKHSPLDREEADSIPYSTFGEKLFTTFSILCTCLCGVSRSV